MPKITELPLKATLSTDDYMAISNESASYKNPIGQVLNDMAEYNSQVNASQDRRLHLLEEASLGKLYTQETNTSFSNDVNVPSGALSLATLDMLGGMSRKGKNLVDYKKVKPNGWTDPALQYEIDDKGFVLSYKSEDTYNVRRLATIPCDLVSGLTYVVKYEFINNGTSTERLQCLVRGTNTQYITNGVSFVANENKNQLVIYVGNIPVGTNFYIYNIQLEQGSTPTPYEPYTPNLINAEVDDVVSYGKNLLRPTLGTTTLNGVTCTNNGDGTYTLNGTCVGDDGFRIPFDGNNKTYKVLDNNIGNGWCGVLNGGSYSNIVFGGQSGVIINNSQYVIQINNGAKYNNVVVKPMITEDLSATSYVPYREPIHKPIPSSVQTLPNYGIGINNNVYNYLEFKDGRALYHENCGVTDGGLLGWNYSGLGHFFAPLSTLRDGNDLPLLCSKLTTSTWANVQAKSEDKIIATSSGKYLRAYDSGFGGDASSFKTSMNGVPIYYPLETETITDVTDLFPLNFNELEVEANGHISFHYDNDYKVDIPNTISYLIDLKGALNNG